MAKTIDLEVWIPSMECYKEVSSVSNALDYQARRGATRYKFVGDKTTEFVHTLNGSGVALPRTLITLLETHQQPDGTVLLPKALQPYAGFDKLGSI